MNDRASLTREVQLALRAMGAGLGRLNEAVGAVVELNGIDIEVLDYLGRAGPLSPTEVASALHIHRATLTGILDRLERGGWLARDRDPADRRKISLRAVRNRAPELVRLYGPMNRSIAEICEGLSVDQLAAVREFLAAVAEAADRSTETLEP